MSGYTAFNGTTGTYIPMNNHSGYGQSAGTGTTPMDQSGSSYGNSAPFGSSQDQRSQQEADTFYRNANFDRWASTRGVSTYRNGSGGGGGYSLGGDHGEMHQSTAGEGLFALAVILGMAAVAIAVIVAVVYVLIRVARSILHRIAR